MKKFVSFLCSIIFVCGISSGALAYTVQCDEVYDFAGPRYGISYIDTDGSTFVGVRAGKIAVSDDFENWDLIKTDDVTAVEYLDGKFRAIHKGYTLVSADGRNWEKQDNNLPATVQSIIKNKNSAENCIVFLLLKSWRSLLFLSVFIFRPQELLLSKKAKTCGRYLEKFPKTDY